MVYYFGIIRNPIGLCPYTMQIFLVSCKLNHYYHGVEKGNQGVNNSDIAQTYMYS